MADNTHVLLIVAAIVFTAYTMLWMDKLLRATRAIAQALSVLAIASIPNEILSTFPSTTPFVGDKNKGANEGR
jgi:hypothetical protein